ncbi:related to phosphoesterase [Lecanosticta acicola]|uniref:Related to phosphoesterase n=1 Tax=Lecanosticta acicola TaxID=111012 RepID=A0AAI8YSP5_9PEZI|nr:related to phosphoesterase [Lecanosticta acicola]
MSKLSESHQVVLPRRRLRRLASRIVGLAPPIKPSETSQHPIRVVCISDTHNSQPDLPPGDLLLHAGDLTEWGSFAEIQAQLSWLSAQPHTHKLIIAGNHDVLFDSAFLESEKERFPVKDGQTRADLDFGSVTYLQDEAKALQFPALGRSCTIYGSPWTPKYVKSAFQYSREDDIWSEKIPNDVDIVLTHGPPHGHLDGSRRSGCHYLAKAITERRPSLVVFGHIHVGHGKEIVRFDSLRNIYEDVERDWSGWEMIPIMIMLLLWARQSTAVTKILSIRRPERLTQLINAAIVGEGNRPCNEAMVVNI